jgi:hypothetical protein
MREPVIARLKGLFFDPEREFAQIARTPASSLQLMVLYVIPLALLTSLATTVGMSLFDTAWDASQGYRVPPDRVFQTGVANFVFEVISLPIIAAIFFVLMRMDRRHRDFRGAMNVAVYGAIPLMVSGVLLFLPINVIICVIAMLHTFVLYWIGVQRVLHIRPANASIFVALAMTITFGASTLLGSFAAKMGLA